MSQLLQYDEELRDLWSRRPRLDQAGWTRLCSIVVEVLRDYRPRELSGLAEDIDYYINCFLDEKVLRRDLSSNCDHVGALRYYYRRFLIDELRDLSRRSRVELPADDDSGSDSPRSLIERAGTPEDTSDPIEDLREAGLSPEKIAKSAAAWLAGSEEWVRIFVGLHNCPDAESSERLVHLARRTGIKSQAYRAKQLGFNWTGESYEGFSDTLIGQWICSLGIEIVPESISLIHGALKILCLEALLWAEQQETAP